MGGRGAPDRGGGLLGLAAIGLLDLDHQRGAVVGGRAAHVGDAGNAGALENIPGERRRAAPRLMIGVLVEHLRHSAFERAAEDRVVAVGDGGHAHLVLGRLVAAEIAGVFAERAFHLEFRGVGLRSSPRSRSRREAGTCSGTVSQSTSSTGAPRSAPMTSYSDTSGGTGEAAQNGRHGSQPIEKATGISSPLPVYLAKSWPRYAGRATAARGCRSSCRSCRDRCRHSCGRWRDRASTVPCMVLM